MGRKRILKPKDTLPLDTPESVLDMASAMVEELVSFCRTNGVTAVVSLAVYDRLLDTEVRRHEATGSTSSRVGLLRLAEHEASVVAMEEDDPLGDDP